MPQIPDNLYRILIIGGSKTNSLFNLINEEPDINKNCLHAKDPYGENYQFY